MNENIFRVATKRVVVALDANDDHTEEIIAKMDQARKAVQSKIEGAKRNARARKETALLKKMAAFFREKDDSTFVHPLDQMKEEVKLENERMALVQNGLLPPNAQVLGRPWFEFLGNNIGVNELFYEQLLRENVRMEKEFMEGEINVVVFWNGL